MRSGSTGPGPPTSRWPAGVLLPIHAYPLFENALRAANGWTLDEHAARIGALWSRFSEVAAANPYAWIRRAHARPRRSRPVAGQPDGLLPLPQALHGQHAGRPGCRATSCARSRRPGPPGCPRTAGSSRCRGPMPTTTGSSRTAPNSTAPPPSGWPPAAALELAGVGIDDVGPDRPLLVLPLRGADRRRASSACRSTIPAGR